MPIPREVSKLVERFDENRESYRSSEYNEAQVRLELINPFFKALGWDMYNEASYAEAYKDVVHEDAIKIGGATKAPDYAFRIGGARKFFVEAMLRLHKNLQPAKTDHEKKLIQRQIDATDKQIDQLVYELYGVMDEEIRIIETTQSRRQIDETT